jgi:SAM-dependent methyltransferase
VRDYSLRDVEHCNMCGVTIDNARVLGRRLSTSQGLRPTRKVGVSTTIMRCGGCGLVFANPLPVPHDIGQHYDTPPEDYWKPAYFEHDPEYFAPQIETFRRLWNGTRDPVALDVGAGIGKCMRSLTASGFEAYGLEPSAAFRQAAIEKGAISADRLKLGAVETVGYEPGTFDFATFGAVLEHVADPAGQLERVMGWLAPGGLLHLEVPSADWLTSRVFNLAYRVQGLDYVTNLSPLHPPYHLYEFTPESFRRHAQRAGHAVALEQQMTGRDTFLPGPDELWRRLMARTGTGMQLEVWLRALPDGDGA